MLESTVLASDLACEIKYTKIFVGILFVPLEALHEIIRTTRLLLENVDITKLGS